MRQVNQSSIIEKAILECITQGMTDKKLITTKVCDQLDVPRPTVRRVKKDLLKKLRNYVEILKE